MAIFLDSNIRTAYVQAETFCSILTLKKADLDSIKINYPNVAKDIRKEAEKRALETREIEDAHREEEWHEIDNPEEEKRDLERMYGTPPGFRVQQFSPKMFDTNSRRSSFEIQRTPSNNEDITKGVVKPFACRPRRSSLFIKQNSGLDNSDGDNQLPKMNKFMKQRSESSLPIRAAQPGGGLLHLKNTERNKYSSYEDKSKSY